MTVRARPGLVTLYNIRPGNGAGQFLQPHSPHGALSTEFCENLCVVFFVILLTNTETTLMLTKI